MAYEDLLGPDGSSDNNPGIQAIVSYAAISEFATIEAIAAAPSTLAEEAEISADHTFNTGGRFYKLHCTETKGQVLEESVGDRESRGKNPKVTLVLPADSPSTFGFSNVIKRDKFMFLIPLAMGQVIQIGTEFHPATVMPSYDSGTNDSGGNYHTFEVSSFQPNTVIYSGAISYTAAT